MPVPRPRPLLVALPPPPSWRAEAHPPRPRRRAHVRRRRGLPGDDRARLRIHDDPAQPPQRVVTDRVQRGRLRPRARRRPRSGSATSSASTPRSRGPWAQEALGGRHAGGRRRQRARAGEDRRTAAGRDPRRVLVHRPRHVRAARAASPRPSPRRRRPWRHTWQEQTRITGRALGLTDRAEQVVADTEAALRRRQGGEPRVRREDAGRRASSSEDETYALGTDDLRTQLFTGLGLHAARHVDHAEPSSCSVSSTRTCWSSSAQSRAAAEADQQLAALRRGARRPRGVPRRLLDAVRRGAGLRQPAEPAVRASTSRYPR